MGSRKIKNLAFFIIFATSAFILIAQEIAHKTGVVNIEVPVRVYDGKKFVENLTINDFIIYEDGKKQKIDAVYLIKERTIERKESVEKEDIIRKEELGERFAPEKQRHFILVFELLEYLPQIKDVVNYFFQNVMQPEDTLQVLTPVKSYRMNTESFKTKAKEEMADVLLRIIKKDVGIGNSEYRHIIVELKKIVRAVGIILSPEGSDVERMLDEFSSSIYFSGEREDLHHVLSAYEEFMSQLEMIRGINQKQLIDFGTSLKKRDGQKIVFLLYQREHIPQVDHKIMLQYSNLFQDDPGMYLKLSNLMGFRSMDYSLDVDMVKQAYADSSISAHFMFLTKIAEQTPFIDMQEYSSDVFSAFKSLADATGGIAESSSSPKFLMEKAVEATENYYLLYYTPKDYKADGKFKKITVKVKGKKYRVTHRAGYIAE
jgi:hypothetical protein